MPEAGAAMPLTSLHTVPSQAALLKSSRKDPFRQQPPGCKHIYRSKRDKVCAGESRQAEVPAFALQDAALTALYGLVGTFGRDLEPLVRGSSHKLPYGSASEAALLLARCSTLQE